MEHAHAPTSAATTLPKPTLPLYAGVAPGAPPPPPPPPQRTLGGMPLPAPAPAPAPGHGVRLPGVTTALGGALALGGRGNGLEYAQMRKEKAREEYKERRRLELLAAGDVERTKRRKKNDTTMSENQKYHRRLKMNQDSAAAARHAQEVYISTLENLVEVTENEKSILSIQALNLKSERDDLMRRVGQLQEQLTAAAARGAPPGTEKAAAQAQHDLKTILDILDAQGQAQPQERFHQPSNAVQTTRAV